MDGNRDKQMNELVSKFKATLFDMLEFTINLTDEEAEEFGVELDSVLREASEFIEAIGSGDSGPLN